MIFKSLFSAYELIIRKDMKASIWEFQRGILHRCRISKKPLNTLVHLIHCTLSELPWQLTA